MLSMGIWYSRAALNSYTHTLLGSEFEVLGQVTCGVEMMSLCLGWGWQNQLKQLPTSMFEIYKVFDNIDMLCIGIQYEPYTVISTILGSDYGVLSHLSLWWSNVVIVPWSWLRLTATSHIDNVSCWGVEVDVYISLISHLFIFFSSSSWHRSRSR